MIEIVSIILGRDFGEGLPDRGCEWLWCGRRRCDEFVTISLFCAVPLALAPSDSERALVSVPISSRCLLMREEGARLPRLWFVARTRKRLVTLSRCDAIQRRPTDDRMFVFENARRR